MTPAPPILQTTSRIPLGSSEVWVSPLGIGTWAWGDRLFWGYGGQYRDEDLQAAFATCLEAGINFFDTAEVYGLGRSEQLLGQFASGQSLVMASKFMPYPWRFAPQSLRDALRHSLQRLGLDCLDLYQIHWPIPLLAIEVWVEALADVVEAGLARAVGVSNYSADQMRRAHAVLQARGIPLASNQVQYSLLHRQPERDGVRQACQELGVTLIAYSPLGMGLLTGKYNPERLPAGPRRWTAATKLAQVKPLLDAMQPIATHHGKSLAQVALNWTIAKGSLPIPGAKNARQAAENAGALGWSLTAEEVGALDQASQDF
ncbi:MAG: aldo/keto reductase [Cyanobacteriota bacterium]|nr:aldo/keto reductase [Cyanobacteriota bacterium]